MLSFRCDCCGKKITKVVDVAQIRLIPYAYVPDEEKLMRDPSIEEFIGELCKDCSEELEDFLTARQEKLAKDKGNAADNPEGSSIRFRCKLVFEDGETVVIGSNADSTEDLPPKGETGRTPPMNPYGEGRCITIARIRAGMKQWEMGEQCFSEQAYVSLWERGKVRPDWNRLEQILPELPEIRKKGCAAYCGHADVCLARGECYYARYRVKNEKDDHGKNL